MNSCSKKMCHGAVVAKGLCKKHYNVAYWATRRGTPIPRAVRICSACPEKAVAKGMCRTHYSAHRYFTVVRHQPLSLPRKRNARDWELRNKYGITLEQFHAMAKAQKGLCAICRNLPRNKYGLCVDHCHKTGRVRGLLCAGCNTAVGVLERDKKWHAAAFSYLKTAAAA